FERSCSAASATGQRAKRRGITDAPDQAERLARPLPRRRRITARPPRVRIRMRNPCVLLRLRLFGWNVLFTHGLLEAPGAEEGPGSGARIARNAARRSCSAGAPADTAVYVERARPAIRAPSRRRFQNL